ncbi:MAG: hypothetical protein HUJ97_00580 [Bacteroidales bacterium]|nr:hypothetical protein [Bacteroidales bacterium]
MINFIKRYWNRPAFLHLFELLPMRKLEPSQIPIDVVVLLLPRDLHIFRLGLEGIRNCVTNTISEIYVVAPEDAEVRQFCKDNGLNFVPENEVFGYPPSELGLCITEPSGKSYMKNGWVFQQFVKLSGKIGKSQYYLCIDADHVLLKPHTFLCKDGLPVFYMSSENHQPYYDILYKLIGKRRLTPLSYVAHKMLFDKKQLENLHNCIEDYCEMSWKDAILEKYDRTISSGFSEFELYGNFVAKKHMRPWIEIAKSYKDLDSYDNLVAKWSSKYNAITFPGWLNE